MARELYEEGFPTPGQVAVAGKKNASDKWHGSSIRKILKNSHYTGDLVHGRTTTRSFTNKNRNQVYLEMLIIVPNPHDAIILKNDF
ncbi:recombinase family protein [Bacillus sp. 205(2023)]|uniref:recombinase family protein n=1 Tax=Bacillus sp. 205(2023) TaxID=3096767 RepID=UPI003FA53F28